VSKLLFRLNFFVAFVCLALNREYMQYYVCALHTFYFLVVYGMMGILSSWNSHARLLALKFVALIIVLIVLFDLPSSAPLFASIFGQFSLFKWKGSLHEWWFRSSLDHYATVFGMLCAWQIGRFEALLNAIAGGGGRKKVMQLGAATLLLGVAALWMVYILWLPKNAYNILHPYTSLLPILLYIVLRNLTGTLRRSVLFVLTWFGRITLETYILQFHVWLSDDAATIVMYMHNYPMINWIAMTAMYVALSVLMFQ
jgi:hypothetical protein